MKSLKEVPHWSSSALKTKNSPPNSSLNFKISRYFLSVLIFLQSCANLPDPPSHPSHLPCFYGNGRAPGGGTGCASCDRLINRKCIVPLSCSLLQRALFIPRAAVWHSVLCTWGGRVLCWGGRVSSTEGAGPILRWAGLVQCPYSSITKYIYKKLSWMSSK